MAPRFFSLSNFDPNLQILHSPIIRRALPVRGELAGALTPAFNLQTKRGTGSPVFSGRRNADRYACRSRGPTSVPPTFSFFRHLYDTRTRSTLRDNRVQRERWGNYTIFLLRTANSGLSACVSDNRSLHAVVTDVIAEEKRHLVYIIFDS